MANEQVSSTQPSKQPTTIGAEEHTPENTTVHVKVYSPFKNYFDGMARSISATNKTGPFDILPRHHNFMTLLLPGDLVVRTDKDERHIKISRGVMHVKANQVIVFLDV